MNSENGIVPSKDLRIAVADGFWSRAMGLLFRKGLSLDEGLLIKPCASVHTVGMRFPIDVLFLDAHGGVLHIRRGMAPNRAAAWRKAHAVLELAQGGAEHHGLRVGDRIDLSAAKR